MRRWIVFVSIAIYFLINKLFLDWPSKIAKLVIDEADRMAAIE